MDGAASLGRRRPRFRRRRPKGARMAPERVGVLSANDKKREAVGSGRDPPRPRRESPRRRARFSGRGGRTRRRCAMRDWRLDAATAEARCSHGARAGEGSMYRGASASRRRRGASSPWSRRRSPATGRPRTRSTASGRSVATNSACRSGCSAARRSRRPSRRRRACPRFRNPFSQLALLSVVE